MSEKPAATIMRRLLSLGLHPESPDTVPERTYAGPLMRAAWHPSWLVTCRMGSPTAFPVVIGGMWSMTLMARRPFTEWIVRPPNRGQARILWAGEGKRGPPPWGFKRWPQELPKPSSKVTP